MLNDFSGNPIVIRESVPEDGWRLVAVWRSSVLSTHAFLARPDFEYLEGLVEDFLPGSKVWIAESLGKQLLGFMGLAGGHIESLFVEAHHRRGGIGRALVGHAALFSRVLTVDVNEQNEQAVGFYRHLGFTVTGRSPLDEHGLPYPLLQMRRTL